MTIHCPVCGASIEIEGKTRDGRDIGSCGDAFLFLRGETSYALAWEDADHLDADPTPLPPDRTQRWVRAVVIVCEDGGAPRTVHASPWSQDRAYAGRCAQRWAERNGLVLVTATQTQTAGPHAND